MRSLLFALSIACLTGLPGAAVPARAQEPLLLRIRPNDAALPMGGGSGQMLSEAEVAARARAAREAVWQRAERRARIAIASVCTGCLPPDPSSPADVGPAPIPAPLRPADAAPPDPSPQTEGDL